MFDATVFASFDSGAGWKLPKVRSAQHQDSPDLLFALKQPHKNLFFSFRGGTPRDGEPEVNLDRQLEDNATKALVYVLEHGDRTIVLRAFLSMLDVPIPDSLGSIQFALQRTDIARPSVRHRVALSIAPVRALDAGQGDSHDAGRPDAWIWSDNAFAILVETKVRGAANRAQLSRHIRGASGWSGGPVRLESRTWAEIYDMLLAIRRTQANLDSTTRLLVNELLEYLRMIGLASDATFDLDDFGYFLQAPRDRDDSVRELLKRKLGRFSRELLHSPAMRTVVRSFGASSAKTEDFVSPGVFRKNNDTYWITIGPKERRNTCHFTIRLGQDGISLEAFSPHKSFTKRFIRKIASHPLAFVTTLSAFERSDPYKLRLREAYYHNARSSYKGQRISGRTDFLEVHPHLLTSENVARFIIEPVRHRLEDPSLRPEVFLVRHFALNELVGRADVVDFVAEAARPMLPYLAFALDL